MSMSLEHKLNLFRSFNEICANCGCTYGAHHGGTSPWPRDYCPGTEGRMDWENGPGTIFKYSEKFKEEEKEGEI